MPVITLPSIPKSRCRHGKSFCCQCTYGNKSFMETINRTMDAFTEMNMPIGYRLIKMWNDEVNGKYET